MSNARLSWLVCVVVAAAFSSGCARLQFWALSDEAQVEKTMAEYKLGIDNLDTEAVMDLLADDYVGPRGGGKEGTRQFFQWMEESGETMEMDLEEMEVEVDGETATASGVTGSVQEWDWTASYTFTKTDAGWKLKGISVEQ